MTTATHLSPTPTTLDAARARRLARERREERARLKTAALLEEWIRQGHAPAGAPDDWGASAAAFRLACSCARRFATSLGGDIADPHVLADLKAVKAFAELWIGRAEAMAKGGDRDGGESA